MGASFDSVVDLRLLCLFWEICEPLPLFFQCHRAEIYNLSDWLVTACIVNLLESTVLTEQVKCAKSIGWQGCLILKYFDCYLSVSVKVVNTTLPNLRFNCTLTAFVARISRREPSTIPTWNNDVIYDVF